MFGSDRFTFETPNVIDPGDLPPSRPQRLSGSSGEGTPSTQGSDEDSSSSGNDDYQDARTSPARLLRDIGDLDLTPKASVVPYDPYDEEEGADEAEEDTYRTYSKYGRNQHSLPSVEEARNYAATLLGRNPKRSGDMSPLKRTVKIDAPMRRGYFWHPKKMRYYGIRIMAVLAILGVAIGVGVAVSRKRSGSPDDIPPADPTKISAKYAERREEIVRFLSENDITSMEDFEEEGSPQSKAANWMAAFDRMEVPVPEEYTPYSEFIQRYALAVFFYSTNGSEWDEGLKFLSSEHECGWYETKEMMDHVWQEVAVGVSCDESLLVRSLYIPSNNLLGPLPSELGHLRQLDMLALPHNQISGRLPDEMSMLSNLDYLDLKYNSVSGFLPDWIGDLYRLEVLGLSNNQFAGSVPPNYSTLGRLKTLGLDDNALTGSIEFASYLTKLEYFWADRNLFEGTVNDSFLYKSSKLVQLDLGFNALHGIDFPRHLLQHPNLEVLDMSDLEFTGTLPALVYENNILEYLSIRRGGLGQEIPPTIAKLKKLRHLDLSSNDFTGEMPNEMATMIELSFLFLGDNNFTESNSFPPFLADMKSLHELSLTNTGIGGFIPTWLRHLTELRLVDLSNNNIQGSIPSEVWNLPELSYLIMNDNSLTGEIPTDIESPDKFQIISLYNNPGITGGADYFCQQKPDMDLVAIDCAITCTTDCCTCCSGDDNCFEGEVAKYLTWYEGMWEFNYTRPAYSYDPAILVESGVATVISQNP